MLANFKDAVDQWMEKKGNERLVVYLTRIRIRAVLFFVHPLAARN